MEKRLQRVKYDDYKNSLDLCRRVATQESSSISKEVKDLNFKLNRIENNLNQFLEKEFIRSDASKELEVVLKRLHASIEEDLKNHMNSLHKSISVKDEYLKDYTVTLFGRTKAGKSTLREMLTSGDGTTIGKGAQRTTREIHEYKWNGLKIIDTPGISAFEGQEDIEVAEKVIERTDLIIFLVTNDSIQESEFEKLQMLKSHNKPILIVMNIKRDIENPMLEQLFLKKYRDIITLENNKGNVDRIREYSKKYISDSNIDIIPIHALSGYKSTLEENQELKKNLYNASNIDSLKHYLRHKIISDGRQHRIRSYRDDFIYSLYDIKNILSTNISDIETQLNIALNKYHEVKKWHNKFEISSKKSIENEIEKYFNQLKSKIPKFVDENIGKENSEEIWRQVVRESDIEKNLNDILLNINNEAESQINEFYRQMLFEVKHINMEYDFNEFSKMRKGFLGRFLVAIETIAGLASLIPHTKVIGMVTGFATSIARRFVGSDRERYSYAKRKMMDKFKKQLDETKSTVQKDFTKTFNEKINKSIHHHINSDMKNYLVATENFKEELISNLREIEKIVERHNDYLFKKIYEYTFNEKLNLLIFNISRKQGDYMKVYCTLTIDSFLDNEKLNFFEDSLGEKIIILDKKTQFKEALSNALYHYSEESYSLVIKNNKEADIQLSKEAHNEFKRSIKDEIMIFNQFYKLFKVEIKE